MIRRLFWLWFLACICAAGVANAQSRQARQTAPAEQSEPQTEPTNLDEGKTPAQIFAQSCAVCHDRGQGLTKRLRSAGELRSFLRQHYTIGIQQASMLADFLTSGAVATREAPARAAPERPPLASPEPATASRRPERPERPEKPEEARRPNNAVAATRPSRPLREEEVRPVEPQVVLPPPEPAIADVQQQIEAALAEAAERAAATPLTERLPAPDPARVQEIPL